MEFKRVPGGWPGIQPGSDPRKPYSWSTDKWAKAGDAVMVLIGGDEVIPGQVDMTASVQWPARGEVSAGKEDAADPRSAVKRAEELAEQLQFQRVVILLQDRRLWRDVWGRLAEEEGF